MTDTLHGAITVHIEQMGNERQLPAKLMLVKRDKLKSMMLFSPTSKQQNPCVSIEAKFAYCSVFLLIKPRGRI